MFEYLFDGKPHDDPGRIKLRALWQAADDERTASAQAKSSTGPSVPTIDDPEPGASDFEADNADPLQPGLAELLIDPPPAGGNTPNLLPIRLSLSFSECAEMIEGHGVTLALKDAMLIPTYGKGCAPERGSRAGEPDNNSETLRPGGGAWRVTGPKPGGEHLDGEPLDDNQRLLTLRVAGAENDGMSLTLRSKPTALAVIPDDPADDSRVIKDKLLQILVGRCAVKDKDGWVTWGRATLKRKKPA